MKRRMLNRIVSIALMLAMALSLLPAGGAAEISHGYLVIYNNSDNRVVNFRAKPNTNDDTNFPIARLPEYWVVEVVSHEKGWYKINANINTEGGVQDFRTGYVMDTFLRVMTAAEEYEWLQNPTDKFLPKDAEAFVSPKPSDSPTPDPGPAAGAVVGYVRTVRDKVNLRKEPAGQVLNASNQIPEGIVFPCYAFVVNGAYEWAAVQWDNKVGYIRSDCYVKTDAYGNETGNVPVATLQPTPAPTLKPNTNVVPGQTYGRVTSDNVLFRKSASTSADFWARLYTGWTMLILDVTVKNGITWYKVRGGIPGSADRTYTGYVHGDFFAPVESSVSTQTPAPTGSAADSSYALITLNGINLRQTPGGATLTALMANTVVNVLYVPAGNTANDWYYIETNGVYGYLPATSLRVLTVGELGNYVLPAKPTGTNPPVITGSGFVKLVKDKVNIRKTPGGTSLTAKDADKLPLGTVLDYTEGPVSEGGYIWVKVTHNGITGYVRGDCFVFCDSSGNPVSDATATPAATSTPNGTTGQGYIKLIKGGVNLRNSVWGNVLGTLSRGTVLPYFSIVRKNNASQEIWYEVYSSKYDTFGFVLGSMAELCDANGKAVAPGALPTDTPVTVVGYVATSVSSVWLRKTPYTTADTAGQIKAKGTVLPMIGPAVVTDHTWYPVQTSDGTRGYLRGDCVFELAAWQIELYNATGRLATPTAGPATPKPGNSSYLQVTNGPLWIRETPSKKAATVGQLADGTIIKYDKKQTVSNVIWYQVTDGGKTGWVMGNYVHVLTNAEYAVLVGTPTPVPTATPQGTVNPSDFSDLAMTTTTRVRIRGSASMNGKEIGMVYNSGTVFSYLGSYTVPTAGNPYYWYKIKYQNITGWMRGDCMRVLTKAEKAAYQLNGDPNNTTPVTYRTLSLNSTGDDVTLLQEKLVELGYLAADQVSGIYLSSTQTAVINFQKAKGLTVDGIAGTKTQHALYGTEEKGTDLNNADSSVSVTLYPVEMIDWYKGGIQSIWAVGSTAIITDVYTGISFRAQRLYGDNHADCEPLTVADTAAYCRIYGVSTPQEIEDREQELQSYKRRPLWVTIGGRTFAASMYGIPHNYSGDRIADNGYTGQFCVHFTNSKTHSTGIVDPDASYNGYFGHQSAIKYAYEHSISGTK